MQRLNPILVILATVMAFFVIRTDTFGATPEGNPEPKRMIFKKGDVFLLSELGAVIKNDSGAVTIELLLPEDKRAEEYQTVDLESGDVILMMNGKKIKSIKDLEDNYDLITIGDDIKLGINREGSMMIVSFPKGEEQSQGGQKMMIITSGDEEGDKELGEGPSIKFHTLSVGENSILISELGILLQETDRGLYVLESLPGNASAAKDSVIKGGEKLVSIQGTKVNTIDEFAKIYDDLPEGKTAELSFAKDGNTIDLKFVRTSQDTKSVIIKQQ